MDVLHNFTGFHERYNNSAATSASSELFLQCIFGIK